jgi:hypothetical protein
MHGIENFKIIDAQQARLINNYENTKYKPLKHQGSSMVQ